MHRQKHSDKRLDERLENEDQPTEPRGVFEIFDRDEDAPLAREAEDEHRPEQ